MILTTKFITPKSKRQSYSSYIKYINREDALHETEKLPGHYSNYIDYMNDRKKGAFGFDDSNDKLDDIKTKEKGRIFDEARKNNRILWQDVYSFDNKFLEEEGLYNPKTSELDTKTLIHSARESMKQFKKDNRINSLIWTGSIHRNTDNIHMHIASVNMDEDIKRDSEGIQRGFRTEETIDNMKSKFINTVVDRNKRLDIMTKRRNELVKSDFLIEATDKQKDQLKEIRKRLPDNKNKWQYNRKEIKQLQPLIDEYTNDYIKKYKKSAYNNYYDLLDEEMNLNKRLYGEGTQNHGRYKNSKANKLEELNERMGNSLLNQLKKEDELKVALRNNSFSKTYERENNHLSRKSLVRKRITYNPLMNRRTQYMIERGFNSKYKDQRLEIDNKRLEQSIEQEKARQQYEHEL